MAGSGFSFQPSGGSGQTSSFLDHPFFQSWPTQPSSAPVQNLPTPQRQPTATYNFGQNTNMARQESIQSRFDTNWRQGIQTPARHQGWPQHSSHTTSTATPCITRSTVNANITPFDNFTGSAPPTPIFDIQSYKPSYQRVNHTRVGLDSHLAQNTNPESRPRGITSAGSLPPALPSIQPVPAEKENCQPHAPTRRATGQGSRTGAVNRRSGGDSDDEIKKLTPEGRKAANIKPQKKRKDSEIVVEDKDKADSGDRERRPEGEIQVEELGRGLSDDDKLTIVAYITSAKVWATFRSDKKRVFNKLSSTKLLPANRVPVKVITNFWETCIAKYKAVKGRDNHTGGGDGDADRFVNVDSSDDDEEVPKAGKKKGTRTMTIWGYSDAVMDDFKASKIYSLIDKVAKDDSSIVRDEKINSRIDSGDERIPPKKKQKRTHSNSPDDDSTSLFIRDAVASITEKSKAQLQLALQRENREARAEQDRLALERIRQELEVKKVEADIQKAKMKLIAETINSPDEDTRNTAKAMFAKLDL